MFAKNMPINNKKVEPKYIDIFSWNMIYFVIILTWYSNGYLSVWLLLNF